MTINNLNISYPDFKLNEIIDPEQFDINNKEVVDKVNEIRTLVNKLTDGWVVTNTDSTTTDKAGAELIDLNAIAPFASTKLQAFLQEVIDRLQSTTDASSGADFVASTTITGVTGTTVQAQLESLKALLDSLTTRVQNDENALSTHKTTATLDHPDGSVTTAKLSNSSVTNAKIADASVSTAKFVNLAVTTAKLADANVTRAKIANGAVDLSKADATSFDTRYYTETEIDNKLSSTGGGEAYSIRKGTAFPNSPIEGDVFYRTDLDTEYSYDGVAWVKIGEKPVGDHVALTDPHTQYALDDDLFAHTSNSTNPHNVTASQVGAVDKTGDTMTGPLAVTTLTANSSSVYVKPSGSTGNVHYWIQDETGATRGLLYWERANNKMRLRLYDGAGAVLGELTLGTNELLLGGKTVWTDGNHPKISRGATKPASPKAGDIHIS